MNKFIKFSISISTAVVLSTLVSTGAWAAESFNQAKVSWNTAPGVVHYHLYYKESGSPKWTHAVRRLPANAVSYTIGYLKKGVKYMYNLSAVNAAGKEFWWSGEKTLVNTAAM